MIELISLIGIVFALNLITYGFYKNKKDYKEIKKRKLGNFDKAKVEHYLKLK